MSKHECIEETLSESLDQYDIKLTKEQLKSVTDDILLSVDLYDEHSSYRYADYPNPYEVEVKELKKQVDDMYSKDTYKRLEDDLDDHKREIRRLRNIIDDLNRQLQNN